MSTTGHEHDLAHNSDNPEEPTLFDFAEQGSVEQDATTIIEQSTETQLHPGIIPVEEGGERPVEELPTTLAQDYPHFAETTPTPEKRGNWFTDNKWLAGGLAVLAVVGLGGVARALGGESSDDKTTPVAASTPNPGTTAAPTPSVAPSEVVTAAPTPTDLPSVAPSEAPSATPTPEASIGADGEHVSETEGIIPIAELQKNAAKNAAFKQQLIEAHPELAEFLNKRFVDHQRGAGVLSNASIAAYFKNFTEVVSDPEYVNTFGSVLDTNAENHAIGVNDPNVGSDLMVSDFTGNFDSLVDSRMRGAEKFGNKYYKLLSLDKDVIDGAKEFVANAKKTGENPDTTTIAPDVVKTLEAYNVALDATREVSVVAVYEKFKNASFNNTVDVERVTWTVILNEPAETVTDGTAKVLGVNFALADFSN